MKKVLAWMLAAVWVWMSAAALAREGSSGLPYSFFKNGYAIVCYGNQYGCVDMEGNEVMFPDCSDVSDFNEYGLALARKNGLYGFIDAQGRWVIEPRNINPDTIWEWDGEWFSDGGQWMFEGSREDFYEAFDNYEGVWRYYDPQGNVLLENEYKYVGPFRDGLAVYGTGWKDYFEYSGPDFGFIDREGNVVIEAQYETAWSFSDGVAKVDGPGYQDYIDKKGASLIGRYWNEAKRMSCGLYWVRKYGDGDVPTYQAILDQMGEVIVTLHDNCEVMEDGELLWVFDDGYMGALDGSGIWAVPAEWDYARPFGDESVTVVLRDNMEYIIDRQGRLMCENGFDELNGPQEGMFLVMDEEEERYTFVNERGEYIGQEWGYAYPFCGGMAVVRPLGETFSGYELIDKQGRTISDRMWRYIGNRDKMKWIRFSGCGLIPAQSMDGKWGYIDAETGKTAMEPLWEDATGFSEDRAFVKQDGEWHIIDMSGRLIR